MVRLFGRAWALSAPVEWGVCSSPDLPWLPTLSRWCELAMGDRGDTRGVLCPLLTLGWTPTGEIGLSALPVRFVGILEAVDTTELGPLLIGPNLGAGCNSGAPFA